MQPNPGNDPYQQYQQYPQQNEQYPQQYQQYPQEYEQYPQYQQYDQYQQGQQYQQYQEPSYVPPAYQTGYTAPAMAYQQAGQQPSNTSGLLSMIFGIVSIPVSICCYGVISFGLAVAAIVLGVIGLRKVNEGQATNRGMALAGLICGVVGIMAAVMWLVLLFAINFNFGYGTA